MLRDMATILCKKRAGNNSIFDHDYDYDYEHEHEHEKGCKMRVAVVVSMMLLAGCARTQYADSNPGALKSLPDNRSFHALFVGSCFKNYEFFENAGQHPFWPDVAEFDAVNAWWCAEAALLAYVPDKRFVRDRLARAGFDEVKYFDNAGPALGPDMQFFVAARRDLALVGFRGSEPNLADWVTNSKFVLTPFGSGEVHSGFLEALDEAWGKGKLGAELERLRKENPGRAVWFCGHSLGGAVAVLAAARWHDGHPGALGGAYVFGAPRVGDRAFCLGAKFPVFRVVNHIDLVATVPPLGLYGEVGRLEWINGRGEIQDGAMDAWRVPVAGHIAYFAKNLRRGRFVWLPEDVVDHSPLLYAILEYNNIQN
ncbi:MAG: lipase family protein [Candidatus Sumerlaeia bacterium]